MTFDVANLEAKLSARLIQSNTQQDRIVAVSQTFAEIIEKDRNFGSLLCKIKQAYTDFLQDIGQGTERTLYQEQTIEKMQDLL